MTGRHWRPDEAELLADGFGKETSHAELSKRLNRPWHTIYGKARSLGLQPFRRKPPPWTETEKAYIAGIVDGEGSVLMYSRETGAIRAILSVANTNRELIDWLAFMFGMPNQVVSLPRPNWKTGFQVHVQARWKVHQILVQIEPFLRVKKKQAELVIGYCEWRESLGHRGSARPFTHEERQFAESVIAELSLLNKKGRP